MNHEDIKSRIEKKNTVMVIGNIIIRLAALLILGRIFLGTLAPCRNVDETVIRYIAILVCFLIYNAFARLYKGFEVGDFPISEIVIAHGLAFLFSDIIVWAMCSIFQGALYKWYLILAFLILQMGISILWAFIWNRFYMWLNIPRNIIIINGEQGDTALAAKMASKYIKYNVTKIYDESVGMDTISEAALSASGVVLNRVCEEYKTEILRFCQNNNVCVYIVPELTDLAMKNARMVHHLDTPLLKYESSQQLDRRIQIKRVTDVIMSLIALIVLSPIFAIVAIAIHAEDGGPVFFKQKRCTINNMEFEIYKFRSMCVDADKMGVVPTTENDPRVTKVGRIIRATRIDELPQLINILKGDMSVVGPRPERIEHVKAYTNELPEFALRSQMRGGLTGYAQVYGKYNTTAYDKLCLDLIYIEKWSLLLDFIIILLTIKICLQKESTEGFSEQMASHMQQVTGEFSKDNYDK